MPTLSFVITAETEEAAKGIRAFSQGVGAAVEDINKKSKESANDQRVSLTQLTQGYQSFRTFAVDAIQGVKAVWDFAAQGAQIELARGKMDRLAVSIGTTGEALRANLGEATKGMLSNAEQIQMATDFMSLGLAKTSDQVVRLSRTSSALGMDMNQLVLTLANQTTMRFDQLGVSVAGFDERLQALKDSGMDVNDAFTEAFLQQAEAQIEKVGEATETTAGKMKRAESAIKNLTDGLKEFAAQGVATGADIVEFPAKVTEAFDASAKKIRAEVLAGRMSVADYNNAIKGMAEGLRYGISPAAEQAALKQYTLNDAIVQTERNMNAMDFTARRMAAAQAAQATQAALAEQNAANNKAAIEQHNATMRAYSNELLYNVQKHQEQQAAEQEAAEAMATYRAGVAETVTKIDSMAQSLASATDAQAKQMLAQSALDTLKKAYEEGKIPLDVFNRTTGEVLVKYGLATPKSLEMAEAQKKVNEAFLAGDMPLNNFITASGKIPTLADDGTVSMQELTSLGIVPTTEAVNEQTSAVNNVVLAWDRVPRNVKTVYTVETRGEAPGGSAPASKGYAGGADFIVPPGYPNDSFPLRVQSGERVIVQTPAQQRTVNNNSGGNTIIVNAAAGMDVNVLAQRVVQELGRLTNGAINAGAGMMGM